MKTLFFYGTMRHVPLLECVMERDAARLDFGPATLPGYAVLAAQDGPFPVLIRDDAARTDGVVVRGLSEADIARLSYYEAGFDYDLQRVTLADGTDADVYLPTPDVRATDMLWDFAQWEKRWAALSLYSAREVMEGFGTVPAHVVAARFPQIRGRAWSRVLARSGAARDGAGVMAGRVDIVERRRAHTNFFALDEITLRHEMFDGAMSEPLDRAVFVGYDAAIVLPYDPQRDRVLLVEQLRLGAVGREDPMPWQLEPVAGLIDAGEAPADAARREAKEEAALHLHHLEAAGECYASPGASTDYFHLFVGLCDLPDLAQRIGGEASEGENIRSHVMPFEDLLKMAEARRTVNAPLTLLTYWLAHHRARLHAGDAG